MLNIPRLLIAGTASGVGKTTWTVALTAALRRRGLRVVAFKCGPDYLDPTYHLRATGQPCHNLDGWLMGRDAVLATFSRVAAGADVALIEGVMGLFDGASPESEVGSAAEIAKWLGAPVAVVIDGSGMARTVAALALGLSTFDRELRVGAVLINRVGSPRHLDLLKTASRGIVPVLGGLAEKPALAFPERHLGLHAARANILSEAHLEGWAAAVAEATDLEAVLALARSAPPLEAAPTIRAVKAHERTVRVGLAQDEAFHFYYDDNLARLRDLGVELVPFSPLSDEALPPDLHGLYFGGGYPELHAGKLSANQGMRRDVVDFAARGGPVYGECGGLMYLSNGIRDLEGMEHLMVGLIPGLAVMQDRLQALGYVEVETCAQTLFGEAGLRFRGHQFRYSMLEGAPSDGAYRVRKRRGETHAEGYGSGNVLASYVHGHWASNPKLPEGFARTCLAFKASRG